MDSESAEALTRHRRAAGVTQERLARHLEITREAVGMIEKGKIGVSHDFAHRWYDAVDHLETELGAGK